MCFKLMNGSHRLETPIEILLILTIAYSIVRRFRRNKFMRCRWSRQNWMPRLQIIVRHFVKSRDHLQCWT